jgi:hypothetical protein
MIAPHKYLDLNLSVLNLGGVILNILKEEEILKYSDLLNKVVLLRGENAKEVFVQTISFLYLLGKVEYHTEKDTIEFLK